MIDFDLQTLLCHVLQRPRSFVLTHPDYLLTDQQQSAFEALKMRYQQGEPLAYLIGSKGFWKHDFKVTSAVLIPRPETELLLELALAEAPQGATVIELGVGSGCLCISFALERPDCQVWGIDISVDALAIAQENAKRLQVQNIKWVQSHWLDSFPKQQVDVILSNPPYIAAGDVHLPALHFEPELALVGGESGLEAIEHILCQARDFLKPNGMLALEHGFDQQVVVQGLFKRYAYRDIETKLDLQGHPRVSFGRL